MSPPTSVNQSQRSCDRTVTQSFRHAKKPHSQHTGQGKAEMPFGQFGWNAGIHGECQRAPRTSSASNKGFLTTDAHSPESWGGCQRPDLGGGLRQQDSTHIIVAQRLR
jgi:hypothetical protein